MGYKHDLINRIKNSNKWPSFGRPNFLNDLDEMATDACEKDTIEGYLAALLIYHQLCEEVVRLLLKDAQFYIQLAVFPAEITFSDKPKSMFGSLLENLDATITFKGKDEFIAKCNKLNKIRIEFVHGLTKCMSLSDIRNNLADIKELYDQIYTIFDQAHDHFCLCFKDFKKDIDWEDYLPDND